MAHCRIPHPMRARRHRAETAPGRSWDSPQKGSDFMSMTRVDPHKLADVQELVDDITRVAKVDREALVYIKGYIQGRADQAQSADMAANQAG